MPTFYDKLKGHIPDKVFDQLPIVCPTFKIDGPKRLSHLLGECRHESANFTALTENLNYSAQSLANTWPNRYATLNPSYDSKVTGSKMYMEDKAGKKIPNELANKIQRQPEQIANNTYANRMGNGSVESGDGWDYRGRGYIQLTGKNNYKALGDYLKVDLITNPDLVATTYPLASAAFFFMNNNLWTICDKGVDRPTIEAVCKKVNGGLLGIDERVHFTQEYYSILTT